MLRSLQCDLLQDLVESRRSVGGHLGGKQQRSGKRALEVRRWGHTCAQDQPQLCRAKLAVLQHTLIRRLPSHGFVLRVVVKGSQFCKGGNLEVVSFPKYLDSMLTL